MSELTNQILSRRSFLQRTALGAGAVMVSGAWQFASAANDSALIDSVAAACRRLAPLGWRQLLLDVTGGALDIGAGDLAAQLAKPLRIDRTHPGFGDFNAAGTRAIEAGSPDRSLLYHAFASAGVSSDRAGVALRGFPTLAEIDAVENYVYGVRPPTIASLRARAGGKQLGIVVFALQYRNTPHSVHGRHAELCFSRTGIARVGTIEPLYNPRTRTFESVDPERPFEFRVVPQRFAAYIAMRENGAGSFGPQDALPDDRQRSFWVPLHKLFNGAQCIAGTNIALEVARDLRNEKLARFHQWLRRKKYQTRWRGADLENFPFVIRNERIASFSSRPDYGEGFIEPRPAPLASVAEYQGRRLTWRVDPRFIDNPGSLAFSTAQVIGDGDGAELPQYMYDAGQDLDRPSPEYLNLRHRVNPDGTVDNLNLRSDMMEIIGAGNYEAQHHIDHVGDGWIEARCSALAAEIKTRVPAYAVVAPPDFFPKVSQRELMNWWKEVPQAVRAALWAIPPLTLSQTRIAANIRLPVRFNIDDTTVTAIVTQPGEGNGSVQAPNAPLPQELTGLPDTSPGFFDPGWDTSQGIHDPPFSSAKKFLAGYGLGAPFVEDAKLCAAYGSYWPGVSPDATRTFQPAKSLSGIEYPWPTIAPLTDEEIGIEPSAGGRLMPWDGVPGPRVSPQNARLAVYTDAHRVDYLDMPGTMTAALTSRIDFDEYTARVMAMSRVYWSLGIRDPEFTGGERATYVAITFAKSKWAVLSFKPVDPNDTALAAAESATGARLSGPKRYGFKVFRWGEQKPDPRDIKVVLVEMLETADVYVGGDTVLIRRNEGPWTHDTSIPTS